jgi:hypothetical protein
MTTRTAVLNALALALRTLQRSTPNRKGAHMSIPRSHGVVCAAIAMLVTPMTFATSALGRPSLTTDRGCYSEGEPVRFSGQGFTAAAPIGFLFASNGMLGQATTTADATGAFEFLLRAPRLKDFDAEPPAFDLSATANDQTKFAPDGTIIGPPEDSVAAAQIRISEWTIDIPQWNSSHASARAGQRVRLTTHGWTSTGETLYVHYLRGGKAIRSEKVGALKPPCGDLTKAITTFSSAQLKPGTYSVRFSTSAKWSGKDAWLGYRVVRLVR